MSSGSSATATKSSERYMFDQWNSRIGRTSESSLLRRARCHSRCASTRNPAPSSCRHDRVEDPGVRHRPQRQGRQHHHPGVADDLPRDSLGVLHDRQHRHRDPGVVLAVAHRQRPGVRRRPEEDDEEQHDRWPRELVGDGGPADQGREAPGQPAPHDVLRRTTLQHHRVAEEVERTRRERQPGREPVDEEAQHEGRDDSQRQPEDQGGTRRDDVAGQGAAPGAAHLLVDVAVVDAVQRVRAAGRQGPADHGGDHQPERRHAALREEHHRHRGQQQQLDDARLGQTHVGTHDVPGARRTRDASAHGQLGVERGHEASPSPALDAGLLRQGRIVERERGTDSGEHISGGARPTNRPG